MTGKEASKVIKDGLEDMSLDFADDEQYEALTMAISALEEEPKTGHWIEHPKGVYAHLVCDKCLSNAPYDCRTNYCPNCGAKMVEQESEGAHE